MLSAVSQTRTSSMFPSKKAVVLAAAATLKFRVVFTGADREAVLSNTPSIYKLAVEPS